MEHFPTLSFSNAVVSSGEAHEEVLIKEYFNLLSWRMIHIKYCSILNSSSRTKTYQLYMQEVQLFTMQTTSALGSHFIQKES
jgi:hypothetical protein